MKEYFCGWYFKCQCEDGAIAVIAAFHKNNGRKSCSIQVVTDQGAWNLTFPRHALRRLGKKLRFSIGKNIFSNKGMKLDLKADGLEMRGAVRFGPFTPIRYDIMGPFCCIPFLECRHSVISMLHTVNGSLQVNGRNYVFRDGAGYLEGDRGRSFPREYVWTQCCFDGGSLMLSVADIPLGPFHFTGIIGIVLFRGREYRMATYLGAKALHIRNGEVSVRQGNSVLTARLLEKKSHPLRAPKHGAMTRTIRENPSCRVSYRFHCHGSKLFEFEADNASFEFEYHVF